MTKNNYDIAAYIWPAYTGNEPRTRMFWSDGLGEWQTVKKATKRFNESVWPREPIWGYQNEADPSVMEFQIEKALEYGVNVFIYDWYWYDNRPFLENCLNDGFLKAKNNDKIKFYLMWANHDANHVWQRDLADDFGSTVIWKGGVSLEIFKQIVDRTITKYFTHPSYYKIDGKPVYSIYDFKNLVNGLGGVENTKIALEYFRNQTVKAGFKGLHLQLIAWGKKNLNVSGVDSNGSDFNVSFDEFGFDSITNYQYCHITNVDRNYLDVLTDVEKEFTRIDNEYNVTYFPHASIGWDNTPRFKKARGSICYNNTPENFEKALLLAKNYADTHNLPAKLITINSWNEWTESSYLEPDNIYGYGYLEAIKKVFK